MQTEDKRACAACGAANRVDASSCWQCFGRLNAGLPQAPVGFGAQQQQRLRPGFPPPMPSPIVAPATGHGLFGPSAIIGVLVALAVAAAGFLFVQRIAGADVQLPDTLAGFPQRHDQIADEADQEMEAALDEFGVAYDGAIYGTGPMPEFIIVIAQGESTGTTEEMFDEFVAGLTQAGAQVVSEGTSDDLGGTPHRCVGLRVQGADMGACSWFADGEGGFVLDFDGDHRTTEALLVTIWPELQG